MFKAFFKRSGTAEFAKTLAADIAKRYPPQLEKQGGKRPSLNRLTRIIEDACKKARDFQSVNKLGWLGKARLGNTFRWELQELGYRKDFIEMSTEALIIYISRPNAGSKDEQS